jgi:D-alanyl-D-alanine-carboxypeptidase/D-alanyl-D-alanine-endopeptidase
MKHLFTALALAALAPPALADDRLLAEITGFTGQIFHLDSGVPGLVIATVRDGESAVFGFGEIAKGSGTAPDAETRIGIGSITKPFTGLVLASLAAEGAVQLSAAADPHIGLVEALPQGDGRSIRLIDLATHASGLPRELVEVDGAAPHSDAAFAGHLSTEPLLFAPGTGILYSNVAFDLLAMALSQIAGKPYAELLQAEVLDPIGLADTGYAVPDGVAVMTGYDWNGVEMAAVPAIPNQFGASSLFSTASDMVRFLDWNLDRFGADGMEARGLSHAAHLIRDGLDPVSGMDISGHMDAMGLGWVVMMPEGDRPLILQKSGGSNGVFSYIAFAPARGVGVFMAINQFDFSASAAMARLANGLIGTLAPR